MTRPGDLLLHPAALAAVVVLLANDHILKGQFGNAITGKLSDVAGVFLLPLVMLGCLEVAMWMSRHPGWVSGPRRVLGAVLLTGVGFAAVKAIGPVGDAYGVTIGVLRGGRDPIEVIRDLTDLLVLPVLAGSWLLASRRQMDGAPSPQAPTLGPAAEVASSA